MEPGRRVLRTQTFRTLILSITRASTTSLRMLHSTAPARLANPSAPTPTPSVSGFIPALQRYTFVAPAHHRSYDDFLVLPQMNQAEAEMHAQLPNHTLSDKAIRHTPKNVEEDVPLKTAMWEGVAFQGARGAELERLADGEREAWAEQKKIEDEEWKRGQEWYVAFRAVNPPLFAMA